MYFGRNKLKENTRRFLSGILTINFTADSGEFINDQENYVSPPQPPSSTSNNDHILHIIYSNPPYNASNNKFSSNNKSTFTKPQYRYILPRPPLSNTNNS
ncbi:unnamed protein product [Rhizophagus irregularis]|nr:unnamed protein product [Rhizophagus irregularis]CAB4382914.1 unnamed protein product [Rhizophagus irregularis]CAB4383934.1 unnamed protein product [Rhizophagus irregularis]CAB4398506.1 unnamed protein product [Rhizophagus irregularis]